MAFCVVQTRKNSRCKPTMTVVPSKWVVNGAVYWPPNEFITLSHDANSEPLLNWKQHVCKVLGNGNTFSEAETLMIDLESKTDSDDALMMSRGTRANPASKPAKFSSAIYNLSLPTVNPPLKLLASPKSVAQTEPNVTQSQLSFKRKRGPEGSNANQNIIQSAGQSQLSECTIQNENVSALADRQFVPTNQNIVQSAGPSQCIIRNENVQVIDQQMISAATISDYPLEFSTPTSDGSAMVQHQAQGNIIRLIMGEDGQLCLEEQPNTPQFTQTSHEVILENTEVMEQNEEFESPQDTNYQEPETLHQKLQRMESKIDANSAMLKKCLDFMMNMEKFLKQQPNQNDVETHENHDDFSEFESMPTMDTTEKLVAFEKKLLNPEFHKKIINYYRKMKTLNGKGDGNVIIREILRSFLLPSAIANYSWKGQIVKKGPIIKQLLSFQKELPEFIKFMNSIACAGDSDYNMEKTEKAIANFLRLKFTYVQRDSKRTGERRATFKRIDKTKRISKKKMETVESRQIHDANSNSVRSNAPPGNTDSFSGNNGTNTMRNSGDIVRSVSTVNEHLTEDVENLRKGEDEHAMIKSIQLKGDYDDVFGEREEEEGEEEEEAEEDEDDDVEDPSVKCVE